jgi:hypothetical protein
MSASSGRGRQHALLKEEAQRKIRGASPALGALNVTFLLHCICPLLAQSANLRVELRAGRLLLSYSPFFSIENQLCQQ